MAIQSVSENIYLEYGMHTGEYDIHDMREIFRAQLTL